MFLCVCECVSLCVRVCGCGCMCVCVRGCTLMSPCVSVRLWEGGAVCDEMKVTEVVRGAVGDITHAPQTRSEINYLFS